MNTPIIIILTLAAIGLPLATGVNPLRIWRDTLCLIATLGGAFVAIHLIADITR